MLILHPEKHFFTSLKTVHLLFSGCIQNLQKLNVCTCKLATFTAIAAIITHPQINFLVWLVFFSLLAALADGGFLLLYLQTYLNGLIPRFCHEGHDN